MGIKRVRSSHKMHMKAYQDRGMRITMLNRTRKNTARVTNGTTKTQHSHTQEQHETRGGRRTHTVRYMEAKTVIFSATCENGVPHRHNFFPSRERGTPRHDLGIASADGVPHPDEIFSVVRMGYPIPTRNAQMSFFLFVHRNAVVVSHV